VSGGNVPDLKRLWWSTDEKIGETPVVLVRYQKMLVLLSVREGDLYEE
jgi:hypothetical protein